MECSEPGTLAPERLLAFAVGESDAEVAAHIATCPACAERVSAYTVLDRELRTRLYRATCPPPQTLGELALALLEPHDAGALRAHLADCPHCTAELGALQAALQEDVSHDRRAGTGLLARIPARPISPWAQAASYGGVRGEMGDGARTYEAGGIVISLSSKPEGGLASRWTLLGLVLDEGDGPTTRATSAKLLRSGDLVSEAAVDELGNLMLFGLDAGTYDLEVAVGDRLIMIADVPVGAAMR